MLNKRLKLKSKMFEIYLQILNLNFILTICILESISDVTNLLEKV